MRVLPCVARFRHRTPASGPGRSRSTVRPSRSTTTPPNSMYGASERRWAGLAATSTSRMSACRPCIRALEDALALDRGEFMSGFALRDSEAFDEWQVARRSPIGATCRRPGRLRLPRHRRRDRTGPRGRPPMVGARPAAPTRPPPAHGAARPSWRAAAAIHQYQDCVRIRHRESGVVPLPETTELYEAIRAGSAAGPVAADTRRTGGRRPPSRLGRLLPAGREREIATLRNSYRSVGPDGRLLVVEGEPGIGKTRLVTDFAGMVRETGGIVLEARAYAGEAAIALAPISALIRVGLDRPGAELRLQALFDRSFGRRPERLAPDARPVRVRKGHARPNRPVRWSSPRGRPGGGPDGPRSRTDTGRAHRR